MKDLEGKIAFITGGASGIGLGIAQSLGDAGMAIALADVEENALQEAVGGLRESGVEVHGIVVDVTDRAGMKSAADDAERRFGGVHVVCNNAGVATGGTLDKSTYHDWDWVLGVNLGGVINGVQTFVERIKQHGEGGHIVNTASLAGFVANNAGIYSTSKYAVVGLSEALRPDLAPYNIGVSVLCPGAVSTNIHNSDRNRPGDMAETGGMDDDEIAMNERVITGGTAPRMVGDCVLEAIKANELYIFPHPEFREIVKTRFDRVLASMAAGDIDDERMAKAEQTAAELRSRSTRDPD